MARPLSASKRNGGKSRQPTTPGADAPEGPDAEVVVSYAGKIESARGRVKTAQSELQTIWKEAESVQLHKQALKDALKVKKMSAEDRQAYLANLPRYMRTLGVSFSPDLFAAAGNNEPLSDGEVELKKAVTRGRHDGEAGEPRTRNPYDETLAPSLHAAYNAAWLEGQAALALANPSRAEEMRTAGNA